MSYSASHNIALEHAKACERREDLAFARGDYIDASFWRSALNGYLAQARLFAAAAKASESLNQLVRIGALDDLLMTADELSLAIAEST